MRKNGLLVLVLIWLSIFSIDIYGGEGIRNWFTADTTHSKKQLEALKIQGQIKVDGHLNEQVWKNAPIANNFFTYSPSIGDTSNYTTKVKALYNDNAIFFGVFMRDNPDSIITGLSKRDEGNPNAEKFWVTINPYNDGKNIFQFEVTSTNVQTDMKISPGSHDRNWNAVWKSQVSVVDSGWVVEMKIPYDAIRFPQQKIQKWGINFWRQVRRNRQISCWNFVDRTKDNKGSQYGELVNIQNIKPPFRLSLFPYVSGYLFPGRGNTDYSYSAGMDLKYGINESFTLDMILIPDFGQKKSDNKVLNLSPYEVRYSEKRPFFTEGTELFNKAGLFYSRRVGGKPQNYNDVGTQLKAGEEIVKNPEESNLINATKLSGRTHKGLGLGFFNAETGRTHAIIKDSTGNKRKMLTQPFTNYNLMVVDKNFGQNSYINFINTNYFQPSTGKIEDVIGTAYKISDPSNYYAFWGNAGYSMRKDSSSGNLTQGQSVDARIGKVSGNFQFNYRLNLMTDTYTHNALGYLRKNNELQHNLNFRYGEYEPRGHLLNWNGRVRLEYSSLFKPRNFTEFNIVASGRATFKNYISVGLWSKYRPVEMHDYFEPRVEGRVFDRPEFFYINTWVSTDYRKPLALDLRGGIRSGDGSGYFYTVGPRIRLGNKFVIQYNFQYDKHDNQRGYVTDYSSDSIIFGRRDNITYTNSINGSYIFNNKSWLNLDLRHYWSQIDYDKYYSLGNNGGLSPTLAYQENADYNFNVFNVDLMYSWNFAPGSFLNIVWKNSIYEGEDILKNNFYDFFENLKNTINSKEVQNSISIKISYYLDYKYLLKKTG